MDFLCAMHENNQCGLIAGTKEELARLGRCTLRELDAALDDLKRTKAANVTVSRSDVQNEKPQNAQCNEIITIVSRRMRRKFNERKANRERQKRHRDKKDNGDVTSQSQPPNSNPNHSNEGGGRMEEKAAEPFNYASGTALKELSSKLRGRCLAVELPKWQEFETEAKRMMPDVRAFKVKDWWNSMQRSNPRQWKRWLNMVVAEERRQERNRN